MTNTIPNVPSATAIRRASLFLDSLDSGCNEVKTLRALLSAPSPAGVDGLEVVGTVATMGFGRHCISADFTACDKLKVGDSVTAMLPAQAIIDGLRGEVEALQSMITDLSKTGIRMRAERDNQARRAGELEAALEFACKSLAQVTSSDGSGHADIAVSVLRMAGRKEADASQIVEAYKAGAKWRIDAALSAGKEGE